MYHLPDHNPNLRTLSKALTPKNSGCVCGQPVDCLSPLPQDMCTCLCLGQFSECKKLNSLLWDPIYCLLPGFCFMNSLSYFFFQRPKLYQGPAAPIQPSLRAVPGWRSSSARLRSPPHPPHTCSLLSSLTFLYSCPWNLRSFRRSEPLLSLHSCCQLVQTLTTSALKQLLSHRFVQLLASNHLTTVRLNQLYCQSPLLLLLLLYLFLLILIFPSPLLLTP